MAYQREERIATDEFLRFQIMFGFNNDQQNILRIFDDFSCFL